MALHFYRQSHQRLELSIFAIPKFGVDVTTYYRMMKVLEQRLIELKYNLCHFPNDTRLCASINPQFVTYLRPEAKKVLLQDLLPDSFKEGVGSRLPGGVNFQA